MPLNPELPPPNLPERAVTTVRTAAYQNRKSLYVVAIGGAMFLSMLALSVAFGVAFYGTAAYLAGAGVMNLVAGSR